MSPLLKTIPLLLCIIVISGCASKTPTWTPTIYQSYQVPPYEDAFVKIENASTDFRAREAGSSTESVRLYLKESSTLIKIRKVKSGYKPSFANTYELYVDNPTNNYSTSVISGRCGSYFAYVPGRGIVCWYDGDQFSGRGILRFDETTGTANSNHQGKAVQILRSRTGHPIIAEKTLLVDIYTRQSERKLSADATLYSQDKTTIRYPNLFDFRQSESNDIKPEFFKKTTTHLQIATPQQNGLLSVTTLSQNLEPQKTQEDVFFALLAPDTPKASDFFSYSYEHSMDEVNYEIFDRNPRFNRPMYLTHTLLKAHPAQDGLFVLVGPNGEDLLPENTIGMIPILMDEQVIPHPEQKQPFQAVNGWLVAYPGNSANLSWGWASPELGWFSGPIWKEVYLHERSCEPKIVYQSPDYTQSSTGCHLLQYMNYRFANGTRGSNINQYSEANYATRFVHGPFIVAQHFDNSWQVYTQQVYLHDSQQPNLATYNRPNNFSGALPKAPTDQQAISAAESWLAGYQRNIEERMENRRTTLVAHSRVIQQQLKDERLQQKIAQREAERAEQRKRRMEAEERMAMEGSEARAKSLQNAMSSSFTNRLRNISSAGNSSRTIESLNSMSDRLRQSQGKSY
jgi:hypothetical protein